MRQEVTAIFDIGKTNKKFFLFDKDCVEVYREYSRFEEIEDDDGFPSENLKALETWCKEVFFRTLNSPDFKIIALNLSTYGASFVHLDKNGHTLTPLYNYLKPLDKTVEDDFFRKYGPEDSILEVTGSQNLGMLNSGLQLYWIKNTKIELFKKIEYSLHLPQYLSYLFSGKPFSEFTSIGCHTMLWDYNKKDYHSWVYKEGINKILPTIKPTSHSTTQKYENGSYEVGIGIHDSSAALLPYIRSLKKKFLLVSTGTWSISINPFNTATLTLEDIRKDCLFNMRVDGSPVKVSRLFLGSEYEHQKNVLTSHFKVSDDYHKKMKFDKEIFLNIKTDFKYMFRWKNINNKNMPAQTEIPYERFEFAYHQLVEELILLQLESIVSAMGATKIDNLFIEGGFSNNDVFIKILSSHLPEVKLKTIDSSLGSALGAAIIISDVKLKRKFLKKNYSLKKTGISSQDQTVTVNHIK